jgi:ATP-dependent helicase/nuclease subunit A
LRDPLRMPRRIAEDLRHYQEGLEIAQRIRDRVDGRMPVGRAGAARAMRYSDVLILMRSRTHLPAYEQALRDRGIPYLGGGRGTLLESLEVRDLEALLKVLIGPYNNLALAQVLRSPLFQVADADLLLLAQPTPGLWMERLQTLAGTLPAAHPLSVAALCLARWQEQVGRLPVHDLLDRIYHEGDVIQRFIRAFPGPLQARVRANLTRFLELALEVDSGRYPSLPHFIDRLQELRSHAADAPDDAPPDSSGSERVRIMTIHGAKGLEAPFVVLVDSETSGRSDRAWEALVEWPASQDRPSCLLLAGRKDELDSISAARIQAEEAAAACEEANLLYVALTRARQFLTISAATPGRGSEPGWYTQIASQIDGAERLENGRAWEFEQGERPRLAAVIEGQAAAPAIDARLSQPLSWHTPEREIAPSREGDTFLATASPDVDSRRRGIAIHRFLELLSGPPACDAAQALRKVAREHQRDADDPELLAYLAEARQTLSDTRFQRWFDPDHFDQAYNEMVVSYSEQGALVHGIIDRVVLSGEHVDIIDYKTHQIRAESLNEVRDQYAGQMHLYARAAARLWPGRAIRAWLLFTGCGQSLEVRVREQTTGVSEETV